jgi:sn-glycerol 3-phosphate transport system ATP-binding protein
MTSIRLEGLHKRYGATEVLKGLDLVTAPGEYIVLVGRSGCGKSTLMRCIAGLETISAGTLRLGETVVNDVAPANRGVAMVFQSYALYPHMTVRENIAFPLRIQRVPQAERDARVQAAAALLELDALLDRLPAQLSGGQRQRVAMGRAIVREPSVFLFDEPLSNLDPSLRGHMRAELKALHARLGTTIVHVTHDQTEALTLADRLVVLDEGRIRQHGRPADLLARPADTFVATFLGAPAMNLLPGVHHDGNAAVDGVDGTFSLPLAQPQAGAITLGVRPSDLVPSEDGPLPLRVRFVELLGHEVLVHGTVGAHTVRALMPADAAPCEGDVLRLRGRRWHAFDAATGIRLEEA